MPYKREGKVIYSKSGGQWHKKQECKSVENAKDAMKLLQGLEHGSIKPSEVGKPKKKK